MTVPTVSEFATTYERPDVTFRLARLSEAMSSKPEPSAVTVAPSPGTPALQLFGSLHR